MARKRKQTERRFITMWCNEGIECVIDITDRLSEANNFEKKKVFDLLADPNSDPQNMARRELDTLVGRLKLRATANTQRHYEIYMVIVDFEMTEDTLLDMFRANPQGMADLIREKGVKLHSDRATQKPLIY